ncbi:hypothetical protein B0H10DRAFT_1664964, partial [Mycena sp. CBHHK59/15]
RGLEHDMSGGLLCPIDIDWDDPKVRADLHSGALDFVVSFYARFLYAGFKGNPNNIEDGFLKSKYLVKAYKSVFTTPSSAEGEIEEENTAPPKKKSKGSGKRIHRPVADILNMNGKVTARSIAYIIILVR